ncbi:MAG: hypothetical protein ACI9LE_001787, partial [Paraglaciecola sp.]
MTFQFNQMVTLVSQLLRSDFTGIQLPFHQNRSHSHLKTIKNLINEQKQTKTKKSLHDDLFSNTVYKTTVYNITV